MTSVTIPSNKMPNTLVITSLKDRYDADEVTTFRNCRPFQDWYAEFQSNPYNERLILEKVILSDLDMFGPRVGFCKFTAVVKDKATGIQLPGICLLRGPSVAILVIINCSDNPHLAQKVLLTKQFRSAVAGELKEIPAGMLDASQNVSSKALDELAEETGIHLTQKDLFDLTGWAKMPKGMLVSPGLLDERIHLFSTEISLTEKQMNDLENEEKGEKSEGEIIHLATVDLEEAHTIPDAKLLSSLLLYNKWCRRM